MPETCSGWALRIPWLGEIKSFGSGTDLDIGRSAARAPLEHTAAGRTAQHGRGMVRYIAAAVCLALAAGGCSSAEPATVDQPSAAVSATVEPEPSYGPALPREVAAGNVGGDWPRPSLAGMYAYHPEQTFPSEEHMGIVSMEPPCVYFFSDPDELSAKGIGRRLALSLSYPQARFDESAQTLWNSDIPVTHGTHGARQAEPMTTQRKEARSPTNFICSGMPAPPKELAQHSDWSRWSGIARKICQNSIGVQQNKNNSASVWRTRGLGTSGTCSNTRASPLLASHTPSAGTPASCRLWQSWCRRRFSACILTIPKWS